MLREQIWSKSKNLINKKPSFEGRDSKFDLTNFEIDPETSKFSSRREKKAKGGGQEVPVVPYSVLVGLIPEDLWTSHWFWWRSLY